MNVVFPTPSQMFDSWKELILSLSGASGTPEHLEQWFETVLAAYHEPHRYYHTIRHIVHTLGDAFHLSGSERDGDLRICQLAIWFHDVVLEPRSSTNEEDSAALLEKACCDMALPGDVIQEASELVLMTKDHEPTTSNGRIVSDADMGIFVTSPGTYVQYVKNVRKEYPWANAAQWTAGRSQFLESLIAQHHIFYTSQMIPLEAHARRNISDELLEYRLRLKLAN